MAAMLELSKAFIPCMPRFVQDMPLVRPDIPYPDATLELMPEPRPIMAELLIPDMAELRLEPLPCPIPMPIPILIMDCEPAERPDPPMPCGQDAPPIPDEAEDAPPR